MNINNYIDSEMYEIHSKDGTHIITFNISSINKQITSRMNFSLMRMVSTFFSIELSESLGMIGQWFIDKHGLYNDNDLLKFIKHD